MTTKRLALCALLAAVSCGREGIDATSPTGDPSTGLSSLQLLAIAKCPTYPGGAEISRACMFDSNGRTYAEDGTLYVFPAAPPYGAIFVFQPGYVPLAADVTSEGSGASVRVYAAPYDVGSGSQCCSEDSEANRISADTVLDGNGALIISVPQIVPSGYQIAIILDFGSLYRSRLAPANGGPCDLPDQQACTYASASGFAMRFYVGSAPAGVLVPPGGSPDPAAVPDGACLLSYNTALVSGDDCCYRKGAANTCDTRIKCNDRSGAGCCLIYGTENTSNGQRCCLYADGGNVDGAEECDQLLAAR
jgi:hypothetical protein